MLWLTRRKIRKLIDTERVELAISAAERLTSGEIRVSIAPWFWGSVERAADRAFVRLGMTNTLEQNGILFFVVPARRSFVVLGDAGIHARVGQAFWDEVARALSTHFHCGEFTVGLVAGIEKAAEQLALHFPSVRSGARRERASGRRRRREAPVIPTETTIQRGAPPWSPSRCSRQLVRCGCSRRAAAWILSSVSVVTNALRLRKTEL